MLIGSCTHSVDAKGRLFIPAKWRDDLGDTIIITRGIMTKGNNKCLFGMSVSAWQNFASKFSTLPESDVKAQDIRRIMFANACECDVDKQGRILVSVQLREFANITADAALIGVGTRIEIWDNATWQNHSEEISQDYDAQLEKLAGIGI